MMIASRGFRLVYSFRNFIVNDDSDAVTLLAFDQCCKKKSNVTKLVRRTRNVIELKQRPPTLQEEETQRSRVNYFLRKIGNQVTPELTIENKDDHYTLTSVSTFKTTKLEFDVGKEFENTTPDGRKVKSTVTIEDGKLVQKEYGMGEGDKKNCTYIRELDENKDLKITCTVGNIECIRIYKRL